MQPVYYVVNHAIMLEFDGTGRRDFVSFSFPKLCQGPLFQPSSRVAAAAVPDESLDGRPARLRGFCMCGRGRGRGSGAVTEGKNKSLGSGSLFELRESVPFLRASASRASESIDGTGKIRGMKEEGCHTFVSGIWNIL